MKMKYRTKTKLTLHAAFIDVKNGRGLELIKHRSRMIYLGQPHMILNHHISRKGKIETKNEADQAKLSLQKIDSSLGSG